MRLNLRDRAEALALPDPDASDSDSDVRCPDPGRRAEDVRRERQVPSALPPMIRMADSTAAWRLAGASPVTKLASVHSRRVASVSRR